MPLTIIGDTIAARNSRPTFGPDGTTHAPAKFSDVLRLSRLPIAFSSTRSASGGEIWYCSLAENAGEPV